MLQDDNRELHYTEVFPADFLREAYAAFKLHLHTEIQKDSNFNLTIVELITKHHVMLSKMWAPHFSQDNVVMLVYFCHNHCIEQYFYEKFKNNEPLSREHKTYYVAKHFFMDNVDDDDYELDSIEKQFLELMAEAPESMIDETLELNKKILIETLDKDRERRSI